MLTIRNTTPEIVSRDSVNIGGNEIPVSWQIGVGAIVDQESLRAIRDRGEANWSDEEIDTLARHAEERMHEMFEREYRVAFVLESGDWDIAETFRAFSDDDANAHAEEQHAGKEWYVLDDAGRNINGGPQ